MGMTEVLLALLLGVFASLLAAEWLDWVPRLTEMAIRAAARRLPEKDRDRYHEEWSAIAEEIPGRLSRLLYSLDLIRASSAMIKQSNGTRGLGMKRVFDLAFSGLSLVLMAPLLGFICWRVSRTGPIFDRVRRAGKSGKVFECFKFRTTVPNHQDVLTAYLDEHPNARAEWITRGALGHDPRLTPIGAFLKRTSLDELPQLINVLRGAMSLVGSDDDDP